MSEIWKPVVGFEGYYEVSDSGQVRRLAPAQGTRAGMILKPMVDDKGYFFYNLNAAGSRKRMKAHRIIATAFHGQPPADAPLVRHLDGNPENNTPRNLRWGTPQENSDDRVLHGRSSGSNSRLTECVRGHSLDQGDVRHAVSTHGYSLRVCRECIRIRRRARAI